MKIFSHNVIPKRIVRSVQYVAVLIVLILIHAVSFSQSPNCFSYQAVLRDASGMVRTNAEVSIEISILQGSASGNSVFNETHHVNTNGMGLISLEVGSVNTTDLAGIDWSDGPYFLKIAVDGVDMGTSQLLSVPYALHAQTVETDRVDDADADPANEIQTLILDGSDLSLSNGGGTVTLPGDNWGIQTVMRDATLSGNGTSGSPLKIAGQSASTGQVLKWNGSSWVPGIDDAGESFHLPFEGSELSNDAVLSITNTGHGNGIAGISEPEDMYEFTYGVYGSSSSSVGGGVYGTGVLYGVFGEASGSICYGVYGRATGEDGVGVSGSGTKYGAYGSSTSPEGTGVCGYAGSFSGVNYGVYGDTRSSEGYGVYGRAPVYGVYGSSRDNGGRAVMGEADGQASIGVYGKALAANSTGVWAAGALYDFYAAGPGTNYGSASSIRWKHNIVPIPQPLEKIKAIRGVCFDWDDAHGGTHDVGMIAEEVGKVLPEIVAWEENGIDANGMDYSKTTPLLLEAIKAQQAEIEQLMEEIKRLRERITVMEKNP